MQNQENKCFSWGLVKYLNPEDKTQAKIRKINTKFAKQIDFEDIKFLVLKDYGKVKKKKRYRH